MKRAAAAAMAIALVASCGRPAAPPERSDAASSEPPRADAAPEAPAAGAGGPETFEVTLYFPSASDDRLAGENREIVRTARPDDRGAQILAALLAGPKGSGALPAVPEGTTLRRLWVRDDGTAYADFSDELSRGMTGGTSDELLTLYAIVDSLALNVPEIKRVGVLVAGRERDTLGGHVDVRRPLPPDRSLLPKP